MAYSTTNKAGWATAVSSKASAEAPWVSRIEPEDLGGAVQLPGNQPGSCW